jgi:hypothetical protein
MKVLNVIPDLASVYGAGVWAVVRAASPSVRRLASFIVSVQAEAILKRYMEGQMSCNGTDATTGSMLVKSEHSESRSEIYTFILLLRLYTSSTYYPNSSYWASITPVFQASSLIAR